MEITLNLPDQTIRKIRALSILRGGPSQDIEPLLTDLIDGVLTVSIAEQIGYSQQIEPGYPQPQPMGVPPQYADIAAPAPRRSTQDLSGITDGLGDDDETPADGEEHDAEALIGGAPSLRDEDIEHDTDIEDPDQEAATVASPSKPVPQGQSERLFADVAGIPPPALTEREAKRIKKVNSRATVSLATHGSTR